MALRSRMEYNRIDEIVDGAASLINWAWRKVIEVLEEEGIASPKYREAINNYIRTVRELSLYTSRVGIAMENAGEVVYGNRYYDNAELRPVRAATYCF